MLKKILVTVILSSFLFSGCSSVNTYQRDKYSAYKFIPLTSDFDFIQNKKRIDVYFCETGLNFFDGFLDFGKYSTTFDIKKNGIPLCNAKLAIEGLKFQSGEVIIFGDRKVTIDINKGNSPIFMNVNAKGMCYNPFGEIKSGEDYIIIKSKFLYNYYGQIMEKSQERTGASEFIFELNGEEIGNLDLAGVYTGTTGIFIKEGLSNELYDMVMIGSFILNDFKVNYDRKFSEETGSKNHLIIG